MISINSKRNHHQSMEAVTFLLLLVFGAIKIASSSSKQPSDPIEQLYQRVIQQDSMKQQNHVNIPGHYEFEVAPKMEPPSVRKPPYLQSAQLCPGSDPFAGFSPKDTLCGDLNQGRLPMNPLGQSVLDQSYPFELIKNKTLQFLARALPVLKLEYETIPKVARYLPTNQLLNPTHTSSPLNSEHMQQLNQRLWPQVNDNSLKKRKRRRKRSAGFSPSARQVGGAMITVAEMSPNATLVVSSAHSNSSNVPRAVNSQSNSMNIVTSAASRINRSNNDHEQHLAVITKDGYKSIIVSAPSNLASSANKTAAFLAGQRSTGGFHYSSAWPSAQLHALSPTWTNPEQANNQTNRSHQRTTTTTQTQTTASAQSRNQQVATNSIQVNNDNNRQQQQQHQATNNSAQQQQQQQSEGSNTTSNNLSQNHAKFSAELKTTTTSSPENVQLNARSSASNLLEPEESNLPSSSSSNVLPKNSASSSKNLVSESSAKRRMQLPCSDSNTFTSTICHAVSALIEPPERPPAWLQVAKHLGSVYSGAASASPLNTDNLVSSSNPLWSIVSALVQTDPQQANAKSGTNNNSPSTTNNQKPNLLALLSPFGAYLNGVSAKDATGGHASSKDVDRTGGGSGGLSNLAQGLTSGSTLSKIALAGWASNALTGLVEYFVPSLFQSVANRASSTFAKRKKNFDASETFVDTPASMAMLEGGGSGGQVPANSKQPPTPCPSVEEYISPTFARNYQGQWKYVVQIPHEGYFTQTIQRTSCVRQRCEFTEGVCHESPRWVSLLVAEIYYPNAVFSNSNNQNRAQQQQQQLSTAASFNMGSLLDPPNQLQAGNNMSPQPKMGADHQDSMQMTDPLSNYNHNLNNAFINAASELGWDPNNVASMQQLANAYNYQLLQRNGLLANQQQQQQQQQQVAESRSSNSQPQVASAPATTAQTYAPSYEQMLLSQQQQQQAQLANSPLGGAGYPSGGATYSANSNSNNEYIASLAAEVLRRNPNVNINELIASLLSNQQIARKKRDLGQGAMNSMGSSPPRMHQNKQFSTQINGGNVVPLETLPSLNDINSQPQQTNSQHFKPQQVLAQSHNQQQQQQPVVNLPTMDQQSAGTVTGASDGSGSSNQAAAQATNNADQNGECDGHDKMGCYIVRVYYDWFLVNGSCKCWKTLPERQTAGSSSNSQTTTGNSFLRRIFTG